MQALSKFTTVFVVVALLIACDDGQVDPPPPAVEIEEEVDEKEGSEEVEATGVDSAPSRRLTAEDLDTVGTRIARHGRLGVYMMGMMVTNSTAPLDGDEQITVFVPTDEAFAVHKEEGRLEGIFQKENHERAIQLLFHHMVPKRLTSRNLEEGTMTNILGNEVTIEVHDDTITYGGARVKMADLRAKNGIIHIVDDVVFPEDWE